MESKKTNNNSLYVVIIAMVIVIILSYMKIKGLEHEMDYMRNDYSSEIDLLRSEVASIYSNVDAQLKEQASLLSDVSFDVGVFEANKHEIPITITVVPKTLTEDMQLSITLEDKTAEFERKGDTFVTTIPVGIFMSYDSYPMLSIKTGGETKTQLLEEIDVAYLWTVCLPFLDLQHIKTGYEIGDGIVTFGHEVHIKFGAAENNPSAAFESFYLVGEVNGKEVERCDITDDVLASDGSYHAELTRSYEAKEGDVVRIYIEATDSLGYVHEYLLNHWYSSNGMTTESVYGGEKIYDAQGKCLYGKE